MGETSYPLIINRLGYNPPNGSSSCYPDMPIRGGVGSSQGRQYRFAGSGGSQLQACIRLIIEAGIGFAERPLDCDWKLF